MPTGYTYPVVEGKITEFKDFALSCARAFGALIEMRDEAMDAEIPAEFKPSTHAVESQQKAEAEYERLEAMSPKERLAFGEAKKAETLKMYHEWAERDLERNNRINAMLAKVVEWEPPTSEHQGLKDFMLEQLQISREKDDYTTRAIVTAEATDPLKFYSEARQKAMTDIAYYRKQYAEEVTRVSGRNRWLKELRDSLASTPETTTAG